MWHIDPLLGGGHEIGYCIAAIARLGPQTTEELCFLRGPLGNSWIQQ
jgi:hypothetical protein